LAATVARKTSYSEVAGMPCVREIRREYSKPDHDDRTLLTCSAADKQSLMVNQFS